MLHFTVFSFFEVIPIIFQAIQNHHGEAEGNNPLFISFNKSACIYLIHIVIFLFIRVKLLCMKTYRNKGDFKTSTYKSKNRHFSFDK